jgi:hypothetical protein
MTGLQDRVRTELGMDTPPGEFLVLLAVVGLLLAIGFKVASRTCPQRVRDRGPRQMRAAGGRDTGLSLRR